MTLFHPGDRVRFVEEVMRFPHFKVPVGATGRVVFVGGDRLGVSVDVTIPGCEEWDNVVWWSEDTDTLDELPSDLLVI